VSRPRYARYAGLVGFVVIVLVVITTLLAKSDGASGIAPGQKLPPFAVPLALGSLQGAANTATRPHQGSAGNVPACAVHGPEVLNVCTLYQQGPLVLALFVDEGSCSAVLSEMQTLSRSFPQVRFAAVSIKGERSQLRRLVHSRRLTLPLGIDEEGTLASLYKVFSCPQVDFAYPGGVQQSKALLRTPSLAGLRARVSELLSASRARGWQGSST
jgi:hypothetical protein